ncbi:MAG: hypothetical protein ACJ8GJ_25180 [Vitreoscilla sp.]
MSNDRSGRRAGSRTPRQTGSDNEIGLWRAKTSKEIRKKIDDVTGTYGGIVGMRVVKLKS